jgi:hypothetical protein
MLGYAEQLEFLRPSRKELDELGGHSQLEAVLLRAATATCEFYIGNSPTDGIPYWDTGAPGLARMGNYLDRPAEPFNDDEPVDSSAAAIGCQGLVRLGRYLTSADRSAAEQAGGRRFFQAGLTVLRTLLGAPYLSDELQHQGLLLHSVYHRPRGWDHIPEGRRIPCGEACLWGDYHLREAALYVGHSCRTGPKGRDYTSLTPCREVKNVGMSQMSNERICA